MKIAIAADHGGYEYKNKIIDHYEGSFNFIDLGTNSSDSVDYPDYAYKLSQFILNNEADCGILICGTGIGMSIAANKVAGIRAAVAPNVDFARLAKEHNNANIICLSGRFMSLELCIDCIDAYLSAHFEGEKKDEAGGRHKRRVEKIHSIEKRRNPYC